MDVGVVCQRHVEKPTRIGQHLVEQELRCATLFFFLDKRKRLLSVADGRVFDVHSTDVRHHVIVVELPLVDDRRIELGGLVVGLAGLAVARPIDDVGHDSLEVRNAVGGRFHRVVANVLAQRARVDGGARRLAFAVAIKRSLMCLKQFVKRGFRLIFVGEPTIAPFDGQQIVRSDVRREVFHVVARLCHVVETRIVHNRGRSATHPVGKRARAQRIGGVGRRSDEVMAQSERVPHFVAGHESGSVADEFFGQVEPSRSRVHRACLHRHPVADECLYVVPPDDVGLENLTRARVEGRWSHCVRFFRRGIGQNRRSNVVALALEAVGQVFHAYHILESGPFKSHVPVENTFFNIGSEVRRHGFVDIDENRLLRFREFTAQIGRRVLRFDAPARHVSLRFHALLGVGVLQSRSREIADSLVLLATCHRRFGQQRERGAHFHGDIHFVVPFGDGRRQFGACRHVVLKRLDADDVRQVRFGRCANVDGIENVVQTAVFPVEKVVYLHYDRRRIFRRGLDLQSAQNRVHVVVADRRCQPLPFVDLGRVALLANLHNLALFVPMETHHLIFVVDAFVHARFVEFFRHFQQSVCDEKTTSEQSRRNLEIERVVLADDIHHAVPRHRVAPRQFLVRRHRFRLLHFFLFLEKRSLRRRSHHQCRQRANSKCQSFGKYIVYLHCFKKIKFSYPKQIVNFLICKITKK